MPFIQYLAEQGAIKENQINEILKSAETKYGGSLEAALVEAGIAEETVLKHKGEYYNIPAQKVDIKTFPFEVLEYISQDSAQHYGIVPLQIKEGVLQVGVIDPENTKALDAIQFIASKRGIPYKVFLISESDFKEILKNYKGIAGAAQEAVSEFEISAEKPEEILKEAEKAARGKDEEKIVEEAPIIKLVAVIINNAVEGLASDIHIENTGNKVQVRFRVDGVLHTSLVLPIHVYAGVVARIKILARLRLDEKRKPQDGGFSAKVAARKIDFRVSTFPTHYGEKVVMRILDVEKGIRKLEDLGFRERNLEIVKRALSKPYGLILITGPTGSGKTTTLYSMLNMLDRETKNIVSLEDPVEYRIPGVSQSQVMPEIGYTFSAGLRSVLRQDPDIIMVGEIRDRETAELAIHAALTGHLVFSTLHTNNALGVIPRLVDMGIDPYLIAPTLVLAVAQRLVPVVCSDSKKKVPMDPGIKEMIEKQLADLPEKFRSKITIGKEMYEVIPSPGCPLGVSGRTAVYEMYEVDDDIEKVILENPVEPEIYKAVREKGMLTMKEDAITKALDGEIPFREVHNL